MRKTVSTLDIRRRLGDILNRLALRHDEFIVERKGKALAAIVPVDRLAQMHRFARRHALEFLEKRRGTGLFTDDAASLAAEAVRAARRKAPKRRRKTR